MKIFKQIYLSLLLATLTCSLSEITEAREEKHAVNFSVGPVSIKVLAKNFVATTMDAFLFCYFSDGAGLFKSYPDKKLDLKLKLVENSTDEEGQLYQVDIAGGRLMKWVPFATLQQCSYLLNVSANNPNSDPPTTAWAHVILAGSNMHMPTESLEKFLNDKKLNEKISNKFQPLTLVQKDPYWITEEPTDR